MLVHIRTAVAEAMQSEPSIITTSTKR